MRLIVYYDSSRKDAGRDSYLKAISSRIKNVKLVDVENGKSYTRINVNEDRILIIEPIGKLIKRQIQKIFKNCPQLDIEGRFTGKLTITAEAILRVMEDVEGKEIVIANQSEIIGKPLTIELMRRGANIHSLNSTGNLENIKKADWFITASGRKDFAHSRNDVAGFKKIIDLSDDAPTRKTITKIPTIEILKERLKNSKYDKKIKRTVHWL